uniref:Rhodanese domain-containing protein n=1 Tax=Ascaris lumbricoides TaxID=6252 RepID=A0A0M3IEL8_ASCLU
MFARSLAGVAKHVDPIIVDLRTFSENEYASLLVMHQQK